MYTSSWFHQEPVVSEISDYIGESLRDTKDGYVRRILSSASLPYLSRHPTLLCVTRQNRPWVILGEQWAVSRAGRKVGATNVFKHGCKSPWVPTLTGPFPNGQASASSWLGTKNALYYFAQSANSISSSFRMFVHDGFFLAVLDWFVHQGCACKGSFIFYSPNQKWRNYRWVGKHFGCYQQGHSSPVNTQ